MTVFFASHTITIRRLRPFGATIQNYSATFTAYQADIQPQGATRVEQAGGRVGHLYDCWIDSSVDLKEGDQVDSAGKRYSVKSVSKYESAGLLDHIYVVMESQDGN